MKSTTSSLPRTSISTRKNKRATKLTTLERILHPRGVEEFLAGYFERRPLIIRGTREKFNHLFRAEDFKSGLDYVTEIRAVFPGLWQATIHPADIKEMIKAGASICVTGLEEAHPKLRKIAESIKRELHYAGRISFRSYLSPPGSGFDLHFDARVATTLQISGVKRWWFSPTPVTEFPNANSPRELKVLKRQFELPKPEEMKSVLLRPGDLLCLPAGTWHRACAKSLSLAVNLAFDHTGAGVFDVIVDSLRERLQLNPTWRAPLPSVTQVKRDNLPPAIGAILRERIDMMQRELVELRHDDAALRRAWANSFAFGSE